MSAGRLSRRTILKHAAGALTATLVGPAILPSSVMGAEGRTSPNDRVRVGYIGVGRRSRQLMGLPEGTEITAYADLYQKRLDEMKASNASAKTFLDYREMLASDVIDAVVVATPDHWHTLPVLHACQAKKDVYIEKPMTLTVREGRAIVDAVTKHNVILQTGSQQRSGSTCQRGCKELLEGCIGKIHTIHGANYPSPWDCDLGEEPVPDGLNWDMWCGQTEPRAYHRDLFLPRAEGRTYPDGRPLGWISYRPYSGGEMTGWGAHGLDIVQWALGTNESGPVEIWPEDAPAGPIIYFGKQSEPTPGMEPLIRPVTMKYANGIVLKLDGKGPGGGAVFEGEGGSAMVDRGKYQLIRGGKTESISDPPGEDDTKAHLKNWIDCIRSRQQPIAYAEIGHRSATMCHLGNIARWTGRKLTWDPAKEEFVNDTEANALLSRPMRAPWSL